MHGDESERVNPFPLSLHLSQLQTLVYLFLIVAVAS